MNELINVNNDLLTSDLLTTSVDQLIFGQLTTDSDIDIYKFQTALLPKADGVGFTAKFSINEDFDTQAGWKISLLDNAENVLSSVDSSSFTGFAANGELSLSGSYDSNKIAYVKVEKSDTDIASNSQYKLVFEQHQQMSEDRLNTDAVSIIGDVANHSSFELTGGTDTDTYLFETSTSAAASTLDFVFIDPNATASVSLTASDADGNTVIKDKANSDSSALAITEKSYTHDSTLSFVNNSEAINLKLSFAVVDSDTVSVTLRYSDGSIAKDDNDADISAREIDFNASLSVLHSAGSSNSVKLSIDSIVALNSELTIRTIDGASVLDSSGNAISATLVNHGDKVVFIADASPTAYKLALTSTAAFDYSIQLDGLANRANGPALLTVNDLVGSDYYSNTDFAEAGAAEAALPVYLVNKTTGFDLASVFIPTSLTGSLESMYFMSHDSVAGIGTFATATSISAEDYTALADSQHLDLSSYSADSEFSIWGFAANQSLIAAEVIDGGVRSVGQHNASAIMGATFKVTEQGITSSLNASTIVEGETATLTLSLSQALVGSEEISVSLSNNSSDLSFSSNQVTFNASNQTIEVLVTAIAGDADFSKAEAITIDFTPTTAGFTNLLVPSLNLTTTEDIPSFSISTQNVALVSDGSNYQYTISLDNASSFTTANPANVSIAVASGFIVSTTADIADAVTSAIALSTEKTSVSLFVLADTTAVLDTAIPVTGLESTITHTVALGSVTIANAIDSIIVTRAVIDDTSKVGLSGTATAETIIATAVQETITLLAGDDSVSYTNDSDIHGDTIDGGDGTDVLSLVSAKSHYTITNTGNQTYTIAHHSHVLKISDIENVKFAGASAVAMDSLNEDPIVNSSHGLTDSNFKTAIDTSNTVDLSGLFSDPEGDSLTLYFSVDGGAAPSWVQFNADTNILTLAPEAADLGDYSLIISASDEAVALDPAPNVSFTVAIPATSSDAKILASSTHNITGLNLELWSDDASSAAATYTATNGEITVPTSQTFSQVKLSEASAYNMADAIDISDILLTVKDIIGVSSLTGKAKQAADVNNDAEVDISDVLLMVKHVINIAPIDHFDLVDSNNTRVSQLTDLTSGNVPEYQLIMNGDVNLDGAFIDNYTNALDLV